MRKEPDQILHRLVIRQRLLGPHLPTDLAVCIRGQQTCPPRCAPQSSYVSLTILPPVKPASPEGLNVRVRAVTVQIHCRRSLLEDDFLPRVHQDHLLLDQLDDLVQGTPILLAVDGILGLGMQSVVDDGVEIEEHVRTLHVLSHLLLR